MRIFAATLAATALSSACAVASFAAPVEARPAVGTANSSTIQVQGWWEREHLEDRARKAYSRLPSEAAHRYNHLQHELHRLMQDRRELDERIHRVERQQREILNLE